MAAAGKWEKLLSVPGGEHGWSYHGHASLGANWHGKAVSQSIGQIRAAAEREVNIEKLIQDANAARKQHYSASGSADASGNITGATFTGGSDSSSSSHTEMTNRNNFYISISNVRIIPGSDGSKTDAPPMQPRKYNAWCKLAYDIEVWGPV